MLILKTNYVDDWFTTYYEKIGIRKAMQSYWAESLFMNSQEKLEDAYWAREIDAMADVIMNLWQKYPERFDWLAECRRLIYERTNTNQS